jgi:phosphatidylglycerophosphatase A
MIEKLAAVLTPRHRRAHVTKQESSSLDLPKAAVASSFGLGYSPVAPGTVATIIPAGICWALQTFTPQATSVVGIAVGLALSCILTVGLGEWAERYWGRKDPRRMVLDEWAGYFFTVLFFQAANPLMTLVLAFLATRIFDIIKPPPARQLEKLHAGWGVLLDDLAASVYAVIALHALQWAGAFRPLEKLFGA